MTKAEELLANFFNQFKEIEKLNNQKHQELSAVDKELSSLYHKIEGAVITHVAQSHKLIKDLKVVLEKRRVLKLETIALRSSYDSLKNTMEKLMTTHANILKKNQQVITEIKERAVEPLKTEQK